MTTKSAVLAVILICGVLFVAAIAICAGVLFMTYRTMDSDISPKIDALFAAIENGKFGDTYETETSPEFKQATTLAQYEELGTMLKSKLGPLKSKTMNQFNIKQLNADTLADVGYSASFKNGEGTIRAQFRKVHGEWRLVNFQVNSPELLKGIATKPCPHCGKPAPASAKFCPNCGKPLDEAEKSDAKQAAETS